MKEALLKTFHLNNRDYLSMLQRTKHAIVDFVASCGYYYDFKKYYPRLLTKHSHTECVVIRSIAINDGVVSLFDEYNRIYPLDDFDFHNLNSLLEFIATYE